MNEGGMNIKKKGWGGKKGWKRRRGNKRERKKREWEKRAWQNTLKNESIFALSWKSSNIDFIQQSKVGKKQNSSIIFSKIKAMK